MPENILKKCIYVCIIDVPTHNGQHVSETRPVRTHVSDRSRIICRKCGHNVLLCLRIRLVFVQLQHVHRVCNNMGTMSTST